MKRAFIISDTHFGARSNSTERLDEMASRFRDDFIPKVRQNYKPGDVLIHNGDVFDNRQSINLAVLFETIQIFEQLSKIFVDGIYVIAGNHDVMKKSSNDISSLDCLKHIPHIHILKSPVIYENYYKQKLFFMPRRTNEAEDVKTIEEYEFYKCDYLFCHTNIAGLRFDKNREIDHGMSINLLKRYTRVYSGHIHRGQHINNVTMIGNPYQMTRSDAGNPKGWYILDFADNSEQFFENNHSSKFIKIYLNRFLESTIEDLVTLGTNNRVDLHIPSSYLIKYNVNPVIDALSKVAKKLEVVNYELEVNQDDIAAESLGEDFNILNLCKSYINGDNKIDKHIKDRVYKKIEELYLNLIKEEK